MSYAELLCEFGELLFQEYVYDGISRPDFYGDLVLRSTSVDS